jgi:hypothetical protein
MKVVIEHLMGGNAYLRMTKRQAELANMKSWQKEFFKEVYQSYRRDGKIDPELRRQFMERQELLLEDLEEGGE